MCVRTRLGRRRVFNGALRPELRLGRVRGAGHLRLRARVVRRQLHHSSLPPDVRQRRQLHEPRRMHLSSRVVRPRLPPAELRARVLQRRPVRGPEHVPVPADVAGHRLHAARLLSGILHTEPLRCVADVSALRLWRVVQPDQRLRLRSARPRGRAARGAVGRRFSSDHGPLEAAAAVRRGGAAAQRGFALWPRAGRQLDDVSGEVLAHVALQLAGRGKEVARQLGAS
mmetsp:Transcript_33521/g.117481  ORF Transcript_33521/g.117481 Transcript_33521/m.117481 type:complete len:227 (-) Transcript_33521:3385-4065(-)